nr:muscarinic acetylcholine receptor M2-like [Lytechinus pictus]
MVSTTSTSNAVTAMLVNVTPSSKEGGYVFTDYNQRIGVASLTILISIFGLVGNSLVLFAVSLSRKLQTKVNVFVVNLCVADSIICFVLPFNVVAMLSRQGWPLSPHLCSASAGFLWIALGAGTVTLALIAFNRYYVIKKYDFDTAYTSKKIAFMVVFSWMYPTVLTLIATNVGLGRLGYSEKYKACLQDSTHPLSEYLSLLAGITVFVPSLVVIIFCYVMIFVHVRKHHRHLIRIFIIGDGNRNESFHHSDVENPVTPRTPAQHTHVQFQFPPDSPRATDDPSDVRENLSSSSPSPDTDCLSNPITPIPTSPSSPIANGTVVEPEDGGRNRTKSVSEELSLSVSRRQADITRNVFYVVCAFLICLTPYGIAILLPNSEPGIPWVMLLLQFNTCVNPVIYALKHPTFRDVIPRILRCDFNSIPAKSAWLKKLLGLN